MKLCLRDDDGGGGSIPSGTPGLYFFKLIKLLGFSAGWFGFLSSESYFEKTSSQCFGQKGRKKGGKPIEQVV